jgi:hypothetical protein
VCCGIILSSFQWKDLSPFWDSQKKSRKQTDEVCYCNRPKDFTEGLQNVNKENAVHCTNSRSEGKLNKSFCNAIKLTFLQVSCLCSAEVLNIPMWRDFFFSTSATETYAYIRSVESLFVRILSAPSYLPTTLHITRIWRSEAYVDLKKVAKNTIECIKRRFSLAIWEYFTGYKSYAFGWGYLQVSYKTIHFRVYGKSLRNVCRHSSRANETTNVYRISAQDRTTFLLGITGFLSIFLHSKEILRTVLVSFLEYDGQSSLLL